MSGRPHIAITPRRTGRVFTICGALPTAEDISANTIMHTPREALAAWCCRSCADQYQYPRTVRVPLGMKPPERAITK